MASNITLEPSEETSNNNRLCILLIGGGTVVLRYLVVRYLLKLELKPIKRTTKRALAQPHIDLLYPKPDDLPCLKKFDDTLIKTVIKICFQNSITIMSKSRNELEKEIVKILKRQRFEEYINYPKQKTFLTDKFVVGTAEYDILYPKTGHVSVDDLDLSLLTSVLQDLFRVKGTSKGPDDMPRAEDIAIGDDIVRIQKYRNVLSHYHSAGVATAVYEQYWDDIAKALIRIGGEQIRLLVKSLKTAPLDTEKEKEWRNLMFERHESDMELKKRLKDLTDFMKQLLQTKTPIVRKEFYARNRSKVTSSDAEYQRDVDQESFVVDNYTPDVRTEDPEERIQMSKELSVGTPPSDFMQAEVNSWKQNESLVYETKAYESVSSTLSVNNYVTITGGQRSGKSMLGRHEALRLQKEGYDIYLLSKPDEIRRFCSSNKKQIFLFDDPFGQQNLVDLSAWRACDEEIRCALKDKSIKLIFVIPTEIYNQLRLQRCRCVMMDNVINITGGELRLARSERIQILRKHLEQSGQSMKEVESLPNSLELAIAKCELDSFPSLCQMYIKHKSCSSNPEKIFINPFSTVKETLQQIKSDNPNLFCGLLLCAVIDRFSEDILDLFQDQEELTDKRETVDTCACAMSLQPRGCYDVIRKQLECQVGVLLDISNGVYRIINPLFEEGILILFAKTSDNFMFKYFPSGMIRERVRIGKLLPLDEGQFTLVLEEKERNWDQLGKRLQTDIKSCNFADVFQNPYIGKSSIEKAVFEEIKHMGVDINILDLRSMSMLHWAVLTNNLQLTIHLLKHGADVGVGDDLGIPVLLLAVQCFTQKQQRYPRYDDQGIEILYSRGATEQSREIIHLLLDHKANVNATDRDQNFAILEATKQENIELVQLLLSKYSEEDKELWIYKLVQTVIFAMNSKPKNLDIVQLFLEHTPSIIHWTDEDGFDVLWRAVVSEDTSTIKLFHQYGADINRKYARSQTALMIASERNALKSVKLLLELKADINAKDVEGNSALIISVGKGNCRVATSLVEHGANVEHRNKEGHDALYICKIHCPEILDLFNSDINKREDDKE